VIYQNADGQRLLEIKAKIGPGAPNGPLPPEGRPFGVVAGFNLQLPIPAYGDYSIELFVDDQPSAEKSITLTVTPPLAQPGAGRHA
jgi:hypothetical protein